MVKKKASITEDGLCVEEFIDSLCKENDFSRLKQSISRQADYRVYSTGNISLDCAIGEQDPIIFRKGIPERTIVEAFGRNSSGKTLHAEQLAKSILRDDPDNIVVVLYAEESDLDRWNSIGVTEEEQDRIIVLGCSEGDEVMLHLAERNLDRINVAVQDSRVKLVIIDSIKALTMAKQLYSKKGELNSLEDSEQLALRAKLIGEFLSKFKQVNKKAILYMINQVSDRLMLSPADLIVNPQHTIHTPGGRAKEFEAQLRLQHESRPIYSTNKHELTGKPVLLGWELSIRVIKNKFCRSTGNRVAVANFYFNPAGFNRLEEVLNLNRFLTSVGKSPANLQVSKTTNGRWTLPGSDAAILSKEVREYFNKNKEIFTKLENNILEHSDDLFKLHGEDEDLIF